MNVEEALGRPGAAWASWQPARISYSSFLQRAQERSLEHLSTTAEIPLKSGLSMTMKTALNNSTLKVRHDVAAEHC